MSQTLDIEFIATDLGVPVCATPTTSGWISSVIEVENHALGDLAVYFCSDEYLHRLNQEHLDHDTYTDIITLDHTVGKVVSGELYISVERVQENAILFNSAFELELHRVMIHGTLHLMGYGDKTEEEIKTMRAKEDMYLALLG